MPPGDDGQAEARVSPRGDDEVNFLTYQYHCISTVLRGGQPKDLGAAIGAWEASDEAVLDSRLKGGNVRAGHLPHVERADAVGRRRAQLFHPPCHMFRSAELYKVTTQSASM